MNGGDADSKTELLFFRVPPPQSGHVVRHLKGLPRVAMAAATYSDIDVVAIIDGTHDEINQTYGDIIAVDAPIESLDRFPVDSVVSSEGWNGYHPLLRSFCTAFIRCTLRVPELSMPFSTSVLATLPGVTRLFMNEERQEVVLEAVASNKRAFDDMVMSTIQGQWSVVRSTRTLLAINHLMWYRDLASSNTRAFVSVATSDIPWAMALATQLERDTGIDCWTFHNIPIGASWPRTIDEVIGSARVHLFITSREALDSKECQREFGMVEVTADPLDICCLVLPDLDFADLPTRYRQKECLDARGLFAYPKLLDWIQGRLLPAAT